jgi:hypothetical protein
VELLLEVLHRVMQKFKDGFNSDYYGLWRNGIVTNIKDPNYIDNKNY